MGKSSPRLYSSQQDKSLVQAEVGDVEGEGHQVRGGGRRHRGQDLHAHELRQRQVGKTLFLMEREVVRHTSVEASTDVCLSLHNPPWRV